MIQHRHRSWSPAFTEYVTHKKLREEFRKKYACLVCGEPVLYLYCDERVHIKCFEKYRQP